ncbi:YadA-like family protein [Avibacterium sp. 20-15]|uniref:YadA C-terminal domain-containing protein n=1 Tax=unclassified Avibacterium TaxID=2685287 RepID=UPI002025DB3C|nr:MULTISPECIES: YadA C-terminal domain-containing protein [unclassified Avibacterium]MCW9732785.1 YadA-like family protein [Avibacterium sp. 20-15]URL04926.1 YadA-like family protein [Avibacterium sp. 20-132]
MEQRLEKQNKRLKADIAGANATAVLPQVRGNGKSMVFTAVGTYEGQNAVAVGYSSASDNGNVVLDFTLTQTLAVK